MVGPGRRRAPQARGLPRRPGNLAEGLYGLQGHVDGCSPFALRLAGRALRAGRGPYDLSSLKSLVVGSEPVSAEGLRTFEELAAGHGLSPDALCPGYGLAEASLAVSISSPDEPWSSKRLDAAALSERRWAEDPEGEVELVSCGPALHGVELRTGEADGLGPLEIRSPSLLTRYVGDAEPPVCPDGWLRTADLAHLGSHDVYIAGRTDDVFVIAGRNLDARALDAVAGSHPSTRPRQYRHRPR